MKRPVVLVAFVCTALSLLLFLSAPAANPEESRRIAFWSKQVLRMSENPFLRPWVDASIEDVRSSGLWEYYRTRFDKTVRERADQAARKSFSLTFPHTVNGIGNGLTFRTTTILVNNSETNANGTVYLRKTDGAPFSARTSQGIGSTFDFTLLPGEIYRLETDGSGPLQVGWVEVISDIQLAGSGAFALSNSAGQVLSEVGIGDSPRARSLMIFVDTTEGKNAGYAVANPGSSPAVLRLQLRRLDGSVVATKDSVPLAALNQKAEFVTETFPGADLRNFRGVLLITASGADISVVTLRTRGVQFTSLASAPEVTDTSRQGTAYLARVGDGIFSGLKFQTSAVLLNNSSRKGTASLELFRSDGSPMMVVIGGTRNSRFNVEVPVGGAVELLSDGSANPGSTGWARVTSDIPLSVGGTFAITQSATGAFVSEVGVPSSTEGTRLSISAQVSADVDTGFGLTNIDTFSKSVTLRLIGVSPSAAFAEKTVALDARGHTGRFISELFPEVPGVAQRNFVGRLEAEAAGITALTLRARGALLTSLPVAGFNRAAFAPKLTISAATSLEGSAPAMCLQFTQNTGEALPRKALLQFNKGRIEFSRITEDTQIIGNALQNVLGLLFIGRCFATDITSSSTQFYCVPTFDGISETVPFVGILSNLPGGGVLLGIESNPGQYSSLSTSVRNTLCLDPGLFRLPSGARTEISVSQEYESFQQTPDEGDILKRTASTIFITSGVPAGSPRVDSVAPARVSAGMELLVSGSNFAGTVAGNRVTIEGDGRLPAVVTEATSTLLKIRLPENTVSGPLRVEAGSGVSNDYQLDIVFAPRSSLTFGSLTGNGQTGLNLTLTQRAGQIALLEFTARATAGTWRTGGFATGSVVGTLKLADSTYDLKVKSSEATKLTIDVIEQGKTSAVFVIEVTNNAGGSLLFTPVSFPDTTELQSNLTVDLKLAQPIFIMPSGSGVNFDVNFEIVSMPERHHVKQTVFRVQHRKSFTTQ